MNNLTTILKYEYKKIVAKPQFIISFLLLLVFCSVFSIAIYFGDYYVDGVSVMSKYEHMSIDQNYRRALSGRTLDDVLFSEAVQRYKEFPMEGDIEAQRSAFENEIRPYQSVGDILRRVYNTGSYEEIGQLSGEDIESFYGVRQSLVEKVIDGLPLSDSSKNALFDLNDKVETPLTFEYIDGYQYAMSMFESNVLLIAAFISVFAAGIFSNEYQRRMDAMILTTKNAHKSLVLAKIVVVLTMSAVVTVLAAAVTFVTCMIGFGEEGANAALQVLDIRNVHPFTMAEATFTLYAISLSAMVFMSAFTTMISSMCKSPLTAVSASFLIILLPVMIQTDSATTPAPIYNFLNILPLNAATGFHLFETYMVELFGIVLTPYEFYPVVHIILASVFIIVSVKVFRKHQV